MNKKVLYWVIIIILVKPLLWRFENLSILSPFQYVDELFGMLGFFYIYRHWNSLSDREKRIVRLSVMLICVGLIGTLIAKLQMGYYPLALDAFQCTKCFIVFIYANHVVYEMDDKDKIYIIDKINTLLLPFLIVAFGFAMVNLVADIGMHNTVRHGMRAFMFLCRKSGTFSDLYYYYLIFLTVGYQITNRKKYYRVVIILALITWTLTLRTRSIVYAPLFLLMYWWLVIKNRELKAHISSVLLAGMLVLMLGAEKIESTYADEEAGPRAVLLTYGIKTMLTYMPFGAGLGTYGTDVAAKWYSPLYYDYGIYQLWGMGPEDNMFLHDNYWPAIMGEFGLIGLIIVALIIIVIVSEIYKKYYYNQVGLLITMFLILTRIMNSTAAPAFFGSGTLFLFLLMPLANLNKYNKDQTWYL